jgi:hypothetical protein
MFNDNGGYNYGVADDDWVADMAAIFFVVGIVAMVAAIVSLFWWLS